MCSKYGLLTGPLFVSNCWSCRGRSGWTSRENGTKLYCDIPFGVLRLSCVSDSSRIGPVVTACTANCPVRVSWLDLPEAACGGFAAVAVAIMLTELANYM